MLKKQAEKTYKEYVNQEINIVVYKPKKATKPKVQIEGSVPGIDINLMYLLKTLLKSGYFTKESIIKTLDLADKFKREEEEYENKR